MPEPRPIQVLLINVHSAQNAGDAALTLAAVHQLEENLPGCTVTLAANDPDSFHLPNPILPSFSTTYTHPTPHWEEMLWIGALGGLICLIYRLTGRRNIGLLPQRARALFGAYLDADLVVATPGGYLYSTRGKAFPFLSVVFPFLFAVLAGKPLYCMPQSYGPFRFAWEKRLVRWVLTRARLVMTREPESLPALTDAGLPEAHLTPLVDIAFAFQGAPLSEVANWLKTNIPGAGPHLGVTVLNWGRQSRSFDEQERYETAVAAAACSFIEQHHGRVWFYPQCSGPTPDEDDRLVARRIAARLSDLPESMTVLDEVLPPALLQGIYGQMDLFMGTRMHSNIFALTAGAPVLAIGYLHKTRGIMTALGLSDWMVDISQVQPEALSRQLEQLWQARLSVRAQIATAVPPVSAQARLAGQLIAEDFVQLHPEVPA